MPTDHEIAHRVATETGGLLVRMRGSQEPGTAGARGDAAAHEFICQELARLRPADALLSEEGWMPDRPRGERARERDDAGPRSERPGGRPPVASRRLWIVDPLDGTREYAEAGRTDWAVHVAVVDTERGRPLAAAVALPALGITLSTLDPPSAPPPHAGPPRLVVSRTRPPALSLDLSRALGGELVEMGSAGAKAAAVVRGEAEVYLHSGGQYEWDSCAPAAVAMAAGLHVSRADGAPVVYAQADPSMPDFLVCRPEYADAVIEAVRGFSPR